MDTNIRQVVALYWWRMLCTGIFPFKKRKISWKMHLVCSRFYYRCSLQWLWADSFIHPFILDERFFCLLLLVAVSKILTDQRLESCNSSAASTPSTTSTNRPNPASTTTTTHSPPWLPQISCLTIVAAFLLEMNLLWHYMFPIKGLLLNFCSNLTHYRTCWRQLRLRSQFTCVIRV